MCGITELEIHDIGSSVKRHRRSYLRPSRSWAPYPELGPAELEVIVMNACAAGIRLVMGVTACWVEDDGTLVPYPEKFPAAARHLRTLPVTIACHGLTHCVVGAHRATWWRSNRWAWREFYPWLPETVEREHLRRAKAILEEWCGQAVTRLIPPGDVLSARTVDLAAALGYQELSCKPDAVPVSCRMTHVFPKRLHDRDLVKGRAA